MIAAFKFERLNTTSCQERRNAKYRQFSEFTVLGFPRPSVYGFIEIGVLRMRIR